jgi:hypothetical protein
MARSVEHRYKTLSLIGLDALKAVDGDEGGPF